MAAETQYTANTGAVQISNANTSLDGTGSNIYTVLTAAANGTYIRNITVKAIQNTTEGTVRLFISDTNNNRLIQEIHVPSVTKSATTPAFEYTWNCDIKLETGWVLKTTTQNAETFNVIANAVDWAYYSNSVRPESTNFTANTGMALVNASNTSLTGSGTLGTDIFTILTAGLPATGWKGCRIESIWIKAQVTTTRGMFRVFVYTGSGTFLITEIPVPAITRSATESTFEARTNFNNFELKAGWSLYATTENSEAFSVVVEGNDWKYPA